MHFLSALQANSTYRNEYSSHCFSFLTALFDDYGFLSRDLSVYFFLDAEERALRFHPELK